MTSREKTTIAKLRAVLKITVFEMAEILGLSKDTVQSLESGRMKLQDEHAQKLFHDTGISMSWLLANNPKAPVSGKGEPYTREIFERNQAERKFYDRRPWDRPHPWFQNNDALRCCARVVAILKSASKREEYYMALYRLSVALDELQKNFGQEPGTEFTNKQVDFLKPLIEQGKDPLGAAKRFNAALRPSKRPSKKRRRKA